MSPKVPRTNYDKEPSFPLRPHEPIDYEETGEPTSIEEIPNQNPPPQYATPSNGNSASGVDDADDQS